MTSGVDSRSCRPAKAYMQFWLLPELEAPPLPRPLPGGNYNPHPEESTKGDDPAVE